DALDHRRREEALEAAPAVELDEERAEREDRRDEHEAVVLPPRRRPGRPEELRYLRLREEDVRDRERALQRQLRAQEIAALREREDREHDDRHERAGADAPREPAGERGVADGEEERHRRERELPRDAGDERGIRRAVAA